ncbi:TPA: hypothetical protein ACGF9M_003532, partial [Vibrio cholerae]
PSEYFIAMLADLTPTLVVSSSIDIVHPVLAGKKLEAHIQSSDGALFLFARDVIGNVQEF